MEGERYNNLYVLSGRGFYRPLALYQLGHFHRPELKDHSEEFKKIISNASLDKAKNLEREL